MKLNRTGSNWTELERNKINENWDIIEGSYNDVVGQITDEVVGHLIDSARLDWKEPVDTVEDLPTNAEVGETRMVREADPDGISYVYRYDGEKWEKIQAIDVTLVNEVDNRLSDRLDNVDNRLSDRLDNAVKLISPSMSQPEIQSVLNAGGYIKFLAGIYDIDLSEKTGLEIHGNSTVFFDEGSVIKALPTSNGNYSILSIKGVDNVKIYNANIFGERNEHQGDTGEWGMGIRIEDADNVLVVNPKVSDCWGDGIYLGDNVGTVTIEKPTCDNNRRQGISIISATDVLIDNPICRNTNGTAPESGIDIEPNIGTSGIKNLVIRSPKTENNNGAGIVCSLYGLEGQTDRCNISIINHMDSESRNGIYLSYAKNFEGVILVENPVYTNNKLSAIGFRDYKSSAALVKIISPTIFNPNREYNKETPSASFDHTISVYRASNDDSIGSLGNILITDVFIMNNDKDVYSDFGIYDHYSIPVENIYVSFKKYSNASRQQSYSNSGFFIMEGEIRPVFLTHHSTVSRYRPKYFITSEGSNGTRNVTLLENSEIGTSVFYIHVTNTTTYIEHPNQTILTLETTEGELERIFTSKKGSIIEIEKISETEWLVKRSTGKWSHL